MSGQSGGGRGGLGRGTGLLIVLIFLAALMATQTTYGGRPLTDCISAIIHPQMRPC